MKRIYIYEDSLTDFLKPFSINHATFEMKCGIKTNLERILDIYGTNKKYVLLVRKEIESIIKYRYPEFTVNPKSVQTGYFINGSLAIKEKIELKILENISIANQWWDNIVKSCNKVIHFKYIWDSIDAFNHFLKWDYENCLHDKYSEKTIMKDSKIFVPSSSEIKSGAILDNSSGPIIIGNNVTVDIGALLQGPLYIEDCSYIAPGAKIRGSLIGGYCKIGGEVSNSIFYQYSNKVHDGFIGNSFIGEWVNVGAGTNNSNLKNNYSNVKFSFDGKETYNSKQQFLGVMIGDYTRIGISTMFNTGSYVGIGCNVFGSGFQDKFNNSFSWGSNNEDVKIEKLLATCELMMQRRKFILPIEYKDHLSSLHKIKNKNF